MTVNSVINKTVVATINTAKDTSGQCLSDAADFTIVQSGFKDNVEAKVENTGDGTYMVSFTSVHAAGEALYFCVYGRREDFLYTAI